MSVNRKVTVPRGTSAGRARSSPAPSSSRLSAGALRSGRAAGGRARAGSPARRAGSSSRTASKSHVASARQVVGPSATTWATRGSPSRTDSSPKKSPGPSVAMTSPSRIDPDRAVDDDEEPGPDLALPGDDMVRREVDLDRARRDPVHPVGVDAGEQAGRRPAARRAGRGSGSCGPPDAVPRVALPPCCAARAARVNRAGLARCHHRATCS